MRQLLCMTWGAVEVDNDALYQLRSDPTTFEKIEGPLGARLDPVWHTIHRDTAPKSEEESLWNSHG